MPNNSTCDDVPKRMLKTALQPHKPVGKGKTLADDPMPTDDADALVECGMAT